MGHFLLLNVLRSWDQLHWWMGKKGVLNLRSQETPCQVEGNSCLDHLLDTRVVSFLAYAVASVTYILRSSSSFHPRCMSAWAVAGTCSQDASPCAILIIVTAPHKKAASLHLTWLSSEHL